jgi:hypothetical protein
MFIQVSRILEGKDKTMLEPAIQVKLPTYEEAKSNSEDGTATALEKFIYEREPSSPYDADFRAGLASIIRAQIRVIRDVAAQYPTDVFPEDGETVECKAAKMARLTCANIERRLLALEEV